MKESFKTSDYRSELSYHRSFPICNKQASYCAHQIVCFITSQWLKGLLNCLNFVKGCVINERTNVCLLHGVLRPSRSIVRENTPQCLSLRIEHCLFGGLSSSWEKRMRMKAFRLPTKFETNKHLDKRRTPSVRKPDYQKCQCKIKWARLKDRTKLFQEQKQKAERVLWFSSSSQLASHSTERALHPLFAGFLARHGHFSNRMFFEMNLKVLANPYQF